MVRLQIIGHVTDDAQVRMVNGKQVINFSIFSSDPYTKNNIYVSCTWWNETSVGVHIKKGAQLSADGIPSLVTWTSKGEKRMTLCLRVNSIFFVPENRPVLPVPEELAIAKPFGRHIDDDIPFE